MLVGDNGFHLGEHAGLMRKDTLFEEALHVPLVVAAPGLAHPGAVVSAPVELLDVYPTIVELAGLEAPSGLDGQSLVPLLENPDGAGRGSRRLVPPRAAAGAGLVAPHRAPALHALARRQRGALRRLPLRARVARTSRPPRSAAEQSQRLACAPGSIELVARGAKAPSSPDADAQRAASSISRCCTGRKSSCFTSRKPAGCHSASTCSTDMRCSTRMCEAVAPSSRYSTSATLPVGLRLRRIAAEHRLGLLELVVHVDHQDPVEAARRQLRVGLGPSTGTMPLTPSAAT